MTDVNAKSFADLKNPFHPDMVQFRVGATTADKERGLALAYIDARDIQDRLDEVLGPQNWQQYVEVLDNDTATVALTIRVGDDWLQKSGVCGGSEDKGGAGGVATIAFKRAAVAWGIGRYLYGIKGLWVAIEKKGKNYVVKEKPKLPPEALPEGFKYPGQQRKAVTKKSAEPKVEEVQVVKPAEKLPEEKKPDKVAEKPAPEVKESKADEELKEVVKEPTNDLDRALAYVVPKDSPMAGDTLKEALEGNPSLGKMVVMYLAGEDKSPAGDMYKPKTANDKKVQAAAKFLAKHKEWV